MLLAVLFTQKVLKQNLKRIHQIWNLNLYMENQNFKMRYLQKNSQEKINEFFGIALFLSIWPMGKTRYGLFFIHRKFKKNKQVTLFDNGKMLRDMTYIDDVVDGIISSIDYINTNKINHEIFNLGNDRPISTRFLLETIENKLGLKSQRIIKKSKNEVFFTHANIEKAKNY